MIKYKVVPECALLTDDVTNVLCGKEYELS